MSTTSLGMLARPRISGAALVVVGLALAWWFAWMSPEGAKLASVRQQQVTQKVTAARLSAELAALRADATHVRKASPFLERFAKAIPDVPDSPAIVEQVYQLAQQDGVTLESITDDTLSATKLGYSTIPVAMSVSGGRDALLGFVAGLYRLPRLVTIQSLSLSGSGSVLASGNAKYTASISATAYTTYAPSGTSTTAIAASAGTTG